MGLCLLCACTAVRLAGQLPLTLLRVPRSCLPQILKDIDVDGNGVIDYEASWGSLGKGFYLPDSRGREQPASFACALCVCG